MSNLAYIDELGISEDQADNDTEVEANETTEESQEDLSLDSEENTSDNTDSDTEANSELLKSLQSQIEGMEKRIADKDAYINELREASKQREANNQQEVDVDANEDEEDFWADPDKIIKAQKAEIMQQKEQARIQQLQIAEIHYANTVNDYWKTVNPAELKEAVLSDASFAQEFNSSKEPYRVAYEYLSTRAETKAKSDKAMKDKIIQEYLRENGLQKKESKEVPPNINAGGKSSDTKKPAPSDGFAAVFGSEY